MGYRFIPWAASGGGGGTGIIDSYLSTGGGGYALVRLRSAYSGSCLRIRRSSDNTEQDIGFASDVLDSAALASFCGSDDGYVVKWYDQFASANDLVQSTAGYQPQLVFAGVIMPDILFDGSDDYLISSNNSGTSTGMSQFIAGRIRGRAGASNVGVSTTRTDFGAGAIDYSTTYRVAVQGPGTGWIKYFRDTPSRPGRVWASVIDTTGTPSIAYYLNGTSQSVLASAGTQSGSFTAQKITVGARSDLAANFFSKLAIRALLVYESALNSTDVASISTLIQPDRMPIDALQSYTTNLWSAASHSRVRSGYSGNLLRVRRASDNTEQDIGISSGRLDTSSLASFCSGTNGYATKLYDQSGNGNDWVQSTQANQPKIYDSSTGYLGYAVFDGSNDSVATANNSGTPAAVTIYLRGTLLSETGTEVFLEHSTNYNSNDSVVGYWDSSKIHAGTHKNSPSGSVRYDYTEYFDETLFCIRSNRAAVSAALMTCAFIGGRLLPDTSGGAAVVGTLPTGNMQADKWYLGGRAGSSLFTNLSVKDIVIFEAAHTDAQVNLISYLLGG